MKRILAVILLFLYVGYVSGILLSTYNPGFHLICSEEGNADDCCSKKTGLAADKALLDKISAHYSSTLHSHTVATGKAKLPNAFSCSVITAKFTLSRSEKVSSYSVSKWAQPSAQLTPVFLRNCVLRL